MGNGTESAGVIEEWRQLAFAAALVTRMAPNYTLFCELTGAGDSRVFSNILNVVWEYACGDNLHIDFNKQQDKLETITPDPAQFDVYGVWPALDAVVALASLLSASECFNGDEIDTIVMLSQSTIINFLEATQTDGNTQPHPLLLADQQFCREARRRLGEGVEGLGRSRVVKSARRWAQGVESSNIGLVL